MDDAVFDVTALLLCSSFLYRRCLHKSSTCSTKLIRRDTTALVVGEFLEAFYETTTGNFMVEGIRRLLREIYVEWTHVG